MYRSSNIDMLLQQRYNNAQIRKQGGRHKGPPPFQKKIKNNLSVHLNLLSNNYRRKNNEAAVYCGASKGKDPIYVKEAYELGKYMASKV